MSFDFIQYSEYVDRWGLNWFDPVEFLVLGSSHWDPSHKGYKLNRHPPKYLWSRMRLTAKVADAARDALGRSVYILSAYRSPDYNRAVGGVPHSYHKRFNALDLKISGGNQKPLYDAILSIRRGGMFKGGIGKYSNFVHVDTRGYHANW